MDESRAFARLMFQHMKGPAEHWGSDMAAHMPSLSTLASHWSFGKVVELGVGQGFSTISLMSGLHHGGKQLISYDINPHAPAFVLGLLHEYPHWRDRWDFRLKDSIQAAEDFENGSLSLLFLDTDHRYEPTKKELEAWLPKIHPEGVICGHDYYLERMGDIVCGVKQAVDEFAMAQMPRFHLQVLPHNQGLFVLWPR